MGPLGHASGAQAVPRPPSPAPVAADPVLCLGPALLGDPPAPSDISKLPPRPALLPPAAGGGHRTLLERAVGGRGVEELQAGLPGRARTSPAASRTQRTRMPPVVVEPQDGRGLGPRITRGGSTPIKLFRKQGAIVLY